MFHPEAGPHPHRTLQTIKGLGCKAGLVLNPGTPVALVEPLMDMVDMLLVMSVNPGFGGQKFIHSQLEKIAVLRRLIDSTGREIRLEVDGGVDPKTAPLCIEAGADALVAGTAVFGAPDYRAAIEAIRRGSA
jgi:ribulose-phosphate 3-epimerase